MASLNQVSSVYRKRPGRIPTQTSWQKDIHLSGSLERQHEDQPLIVATIMRAAMQVTAKPTRKRMPEQPALRANLIGSE